MEPRRASGESRVMSRDLVRDDVVLSSSTWVVKVGTGVLTAETGRLDPARIDRLAEQICAILDTGRRVALVSSGAVGAGMGRLGLSRRPDDLRRLQAAAAVGQADLIRSYDDGFRRHGRHAGQLLLTHEDFDSRPRYLNMRNTLTALFEFGAVPVINENDTISIAEIKFGDNDRLAAMVANLLQAPLLIILSVVDGLYATDPAGALLGAPIPLVVDLDDSTLGLAGDGKSARDRRHAEQARSRAVGYARRRVGDHRLGQARRASHSNPRGRTDRHALSRSRTQPSRA